MVSLPTFPSHALIFEHIVVHFAAAQLVDLSGARAHFTVRKREREIFREVTLKRGFIRIEKSLAGIALKLQHLFFSSGLREHARNCTSDQQHN